MEIITADANILKRPHLIRAIYRSGLFGLILPWQWSQARRHLQAASLIRAWPDVAQAFTSASSGDFWRLSPALFSGPLEKIEVDYVRAFAATPEAGEPDEST